MVVIVLIILLIIVMAYRSYMAKTSLYVRLGGIYLIAAVVGHFSDALINNPIVGRDSPNEQLRDWHRNQLTRLPGLKFMRTLWLCDKAGGPFTFVPSSGSTCPFARGQLGAAHTKFNITPVEFDAVAAELSLSLDHFGVPEREKKEVLGVFAAHKCEITGQ